MSHTDPEFCPVCPEGPLLRDLAVSLARLEEKVDSVRVEQARMAVERQDDRKYLVATSERVKSLELASARTVGWASGAAAVVAMLVSILKGMLDKG